MARNWLFLSIASSFGALLMGWLVVVARAVSRKTPIYFIRQILKFQNLRQMEKAATDMMSGLKLGTGSSHGHLEVHHDVNPIKEGGGRVDKE